MSWVRGIAEYLGGLALELAWAAGILVVGIIVIPRLFGRPKPPT